MSRSILWFRRDLRLADHPALVRAFDTATAVLPVFVLDPALLQAGGPRVQRLLASVSALRAATEGALVLRAGTPEAVIPDLAGEIGAAEVHITGEITPYGRARDARVAARLDAQGRRLVATGTPYAVSPGRVRTGGGTPFQVFTPFSRAWRAHGWPAPPAAPTRPRWVAGVDSTEPPAAPEGPTTQLESGEVGEPAARRQWSAFLDEHLSRYDAERDRPDLDTTSRLSVPLKYGEIHPRTLLAGLAAHPAGHTPSADRFVAQLCWREFYADVLWHHPDSAWQDLRPTLSGMAYDDPDGSGVAEAVEAWRAGRTGYPFVDAGLRHLLAEGWMPNRLRMITASFLVKDLHIWWPLGARHFLRHLLDGDVASNSHGWQWVAGTGTDAAPYFRIFNPVGQGLRFDPAGDYVRRWIPELAHLPGRSVHEPWHHPDGYARGYPAPVVDHAEERREALRRVALTRRRRAAEV